MPILIYFTKLFTKVPFCFLYHPCIIFLVSGNLSTPFQDHPHEQSNKEETACSVEKNERILDPDLPYNQINKKQTETECAQYGSHYQKSHLLRVIFCEIGSHLLIRELVAKSYLLYPSKLFHISLSLLNIRALSLLACYERIEEMLLSLLLL